MKTRKYLMILMIPIWISIHGQGTWSQTELTQYKDHMASAVVANQIFFAGGFAVNESASDQFPTDKVEIFDTQTNTWAYNKLSKSRDWLEGVSNGSKVFFAGGWDQFGIFQTRVDIFDTVSQKWTTGELSTARRMLSPISSGNIVMFAGGQTGNGKSSGVIDIYHMDTDIWSRDTLSSPRLGLSAAAVGDLILLAGGLQFDGNIGSEVVKDVVDIYNVKTDTWSTAKLSSPRVFMATVTYGNKILFAGGMDALNPSKVVDIYDASTNTWSVDSLSVPRAFDDNDQNAAVACGKAYFIGGMLRNATDYLKDFNAIDVYDFESGTWSTDTLPYHLFGHSVASTSDQLLVAGGITMTPLGWDIHKEVLIYQCTPSGIELIPNNGKQMAFVPNPTSGYFTIDALEILPSVSPKLAIYDMLGKVVFTQKIISANDELNVSSLDSGIYVVELRSGKQVYQGKLCISR